MIMCVLLCYPVSIRIYYQQGGLFLVTSSVHIVERRKKYACSSILEHQRGKIKKDYESSTVEIGEMQWW